jgi:hypothetical protein
VRQAGRLQLGDGLLDHGVPAVAGLDLGQRQVSVGDEGVEVPGGEQRQLRTRRGPDAAHDQPDGQRLPGAGEADPGGLGDVGAGISGVLSQYGIGVQVSSSIAAIAARIRRLCRTFTENRTSNFLAVSSTACCRTPSPRGRSAARERRRAGPG